MDDLDILIVTTRSDLSLDYFIQKGVCVAFFGDDIPTFTQAIRAHFYPIVYLRDPFNSGKYSLENIILKLGIIQKRLPDAYYVDQARSMGDILIEDKWRQYELWAEWMPRTYLGGTDKGIEGPTLAKKRISARSRDIRFDIFPTELSDDWIVQSRLTIIEEVRVYLLFGQPVPLVCIKRPKGPAQSTKVVGLRNISDEEKKFMRILAGQMKSYDFLGLDIAVTPAGLRLIEVNRSPQFKQYNELSGTNMVADFWPSIQGRFELRT